MIRKVLLATAAMTFGLAAPMQALAQDACVTEGQANAMMVAALPTALSSLSDACSATLPNTAALQRVQGRIGSEFQPAAERAWPEAIEGFASMAKLDLPPGIDKSAMRPFAELMITSMVTQEVKPSHCGVANDIYTALEPLPAQNMGDLVVLLMKLGLSDKQADDSEQPFRLCD